MLSVAVMALDDFVWLTLIKLNIEFFTAIVGFALHYFVSMVD